MRRADRLRRLEIENPGCPTCGRPYSAAGEANAAAVVREALAHPELLDWLRARAMAEDAAVKVGAGERQRKGDDYAI